MMMTWVTHCLTTIYRNIAVIRHSCRPRWLYNLHGRLITSVCTTRSQPHCDRHEEAGNNRDNGSSHNVKPLYPLVSLGAVFLGYIMSQKSKSSCLLKQEKADHSSSVESTNKLSLNEAIEVARDLCQRVKDEAGSPGLVIAVSVDGKYTWSEGFGYADLENRVHCTGDTLMRIASISKPITMAVVAKLWEQGKLDLDKSVNDYVLTWPEKTFKGQKVTITTRQLVSHISGLRHYDKNCGKKINRKEDEKKISSEKGTKEKSENKISSKDADEQEFHLRKRYNSVTEALEIFKDDELCFLPGTEYLYTTHGWTLISAVVEAATKKKFPVLMRDLFKELNMTSTYLDENDPIIYNRARHYRKNKRGCIVNTPYVDLSCKWAGGGLLSTVRDVNTFGNVMLYCYQHEQTDEDCTTPGYLKPATMEMMWGPEKRAKCAWDTDGYYGMGWGVVTPGGEKHGQCREVREYYSHTGGAVGATSAFIVLPRKKKKMTCDGRECVSCPPDGVVVTIISNLGSCSGLTKTSIKIAKLFENVEL